jgi:outer membrane receptor for ferric coprogen and ferric-rhodotorulic acid
MTRTPVRLACLLCCVPALSPAAAPSVPAAPAPGAPPVELSPFVVSTNTDVGYAAENTLAGSRLNTRLRDTAGSVAVFTREFLDDLAITDIRELMEYTVNGEMDTNSQGASSEQNRIIGGHALTAGVQSRGLIAGLGMDYFPSITPPDPYRVGRFEDARGPNSILFGIGSPGGLLNQTSKIAETHRHSGAIRLSAGSWSRQRAELDVNRVLAKDRLAVALSALHQDSGGWRAFDFQDKRRLFGSVVWRPRPNLTLTAMGETGRDKNAVIRSFSDMEQVLAWYDNRQARGVAAVTFAPELVAPTAAMQALGVTARDGTRGGLNRRAVFIENNGVVFDAIGTFLSGSYNSAAVRAPDGTPGVTTGVMRIRDPALYPLNGNGAGPGMYRDQTLSNHTLTLDWQPVRGLILNLAQNYQRTLAEVNLMNGNSPLLRGDPNRTLGIGGPANPYAGRLYFDGSWTRDVHFGETRENRLSASYTWEPRWRWLGRHRLAGARSRTDLTDIRANSWLVLAGRPYNADASSVNNRITVRHYLTEGDFGTYRAGDWRRLPATVNFDGRTFGTAYANVASGGADNGGMMQRIDSTLGAAQSFFWDGRIVTTYGFRDDQVRNTQLAYRNDPVRGDVVDPDPAKGTVNRMEGRTRTAGIVFHVTDWLSAIANRSSNVGVPPLARTTFPEGNLAPLSKGRGEDYGLGFDLLQGRLNARLVYFEGSERGRVTAPVANLLRDRNVRVMQAFESVLVGPGRPYTPAQWEPIRRANTPPVNSISNDFDAKGYEARLTANLTRQWRLVVNYSYTDSGRIGLAQEAIDWYGLRPADPVTLIQGVTQDAAGRYRVDPAAYAPEGTVARWIGLARQSPAAEPGTLTTSTGVTLAQEIFDLVETLNDEKEAQQKRWGVRPHKISFFSAYDFRAGRLAGLTVGGGWRWRSANVIGADATGREITGRVLTAVDLLFAYSLRVPGAPGRLRLQLNVSNALDRGGIVPARLATGVAAPDGFQVPGGRGLGYTRFDLIQPRELRFTTTYSF